MARCRENKKSKCKDQNENYKNNMNTKNTNKTIPKKSKVNDATIKKLSIINEKSTKKITKMSKMSKQNRDNLVKTTKESDSNENESNESEDQDLPELGLDEHLAVALAMIKFGSLDGALDSLKAALELSPNHTSVQTLLGVVYHHMKEASLSIKAFTKAFQLCPQEVIECLELIQDDQMEIAVTAKLLESSLKDNMDNSVIIAGLATCHGVLGDIDAALEVFQRAIQYYPQVAKYHFNLGSIFKEKGNLEEAKLCFQKCIQLEPQNAEEAHLELDSINQELKSL